MGFNNHLAYSTECESIPRRFWGLVDVVSCFCEPVNGARGGGLDILFSGQLGLHGNHESFKVWVVKTKLVLSHREGGAFYVSWTK